MSRPPLAFGAIFGGGAQLRKFGIAFKSGRSGMNEMQRAGKFAWGNGIPELAKEILAALVIGLKVLTLF